MKFGMSTSHVHPSSSVNPLLAHVKRNHISLSVRKWSDLHELRGHTGDCDCLVFFLQELIWRVSLKSVVLRSILTFVYHLDIFGKRTTIENSVDIWADITLKLGHQWVDCVTFCLLSHSPTSPNAILLLLTHFLPWIGVLHLPTPFVCWWLIIFSCFDEE